MVILGVNESAINFIMPLRCFIKIEIAYGKKQTNKQTNILTKNLLGKKKYMNNSFFYIETTKC